jgi:sigma-E factor negative regulatory protein RseB
MRVAHPVAVPSLALFVLLAGQATAQEARDWLERMSSAVEQLNYRGTFVHVHDGTLETLHIVHRNTEGGTGERVLVFPDRRIVLIESRSDSPLVSALPSSAAELEPHYEITLGGDARVAERAVQVLEIKPRDEFRYGHTLWLDQATAIPLRSDLVNEQGDVVEQILFTHIEIAAADADAPLELEVDTTGFTTLRAPESAPPSAEIAWRAAAVPGGFKLSVATQSPIEGSDTPVEHLVYSDGLATVSVFIEDPATKADVREGFSTVGSTNAYSTTVRGRKVTAMGEVPRQTVRTIASSLVAE